MQRDDHGGQVVVGTQHLPVGLLAGGGPHQRRTPGQHLLQRHAVVRPVAQQHPVPGARRIVGLVGDPRQEAPTQPGTHQPALGEHAGQAAVGAQHPADTGVGGLRRRGHSKVVTDRLQHPVNVRPGVGGRTRLTASPAPPGGAAGPGVVHPGQLDGLGRVVRRPAPLPRLLLGLLLPRRLVRVAAQPGEHGGQA